MVTSLGIQPKRAIWITIVLLAGIYLVINLGLLKGIGSLAGSYIVPALMWALLAVFVFFLPRYRPAAKLGRRSAIIQLAFIIGFFQVLLYVIGGTFSSFGKSPYSFTPLGILTNLFLVASMLVGMELSRAWLINRLGKKHTFLALAFIALLFTLLSIPLAQVTGIRPDVKSISFINSDLLPSLAENLLASFLALLAGPLPAIVYRGMLQGFWWFCPILPDLPWAFKGLIGTVLPIIGLLVVNSLYSPQPQRRKARRAKEGSLAGWIITTVVAVAIIWFAVGLFPIHPALVGSGSMRPTMDVGDVVIIAKVPADVVKPGDVIQFRRPEKVTVMHRLVEIQETEEGTKSFITKGDASDEPDTDPVIPENVVGKAIFNIRKVGWMAIIVKSFFTG